MGNFKNEIDEKTIILYDGSCGVCNHWVQWVLKNKPDNSIRFLPQNSTLGSELLEKQGDFKNVDSIFVVTKGNIHFKSEAISFILGHIQSPMRYLKIVFAVIPKWILDKFYDQFAKNRHLFFRNKNSCELISSDQKIFFSIN